LLKSDGDTNDEEEEEEDDDDYSKEEEELHDSRPRSQKHRGSHDGKAGPSRLKK
jgi:hypothetical protein